MEFSDTEFGCPDCPNTPILIRRFGFTYHSSLKEGFCQATGKFHTNERDLNDEFKRMSDAYSERTGLPANFTPLHPSEVSGLNMEGLEDTFRATGQRNTAEVERVVSKSPQSTGKQRKPIRRNYTGGWETPTKV